LPAKAKLQAFSLKSKGPAVAFADSDKALADLQIKECLPILITDEFSDFKIEVDGEREGRVRKGKNRVWFSR